MQTSPHYWRNTFDFSLLDCLVIRAAYIAKHAPVLYGPQYSFMIQNTFCNIQNKWIQFFVNQFNQSFIIVECGEIWRLPVGHFSLNCYQQNTAILSVIWVRVLSVLTPSPNSKLNNVFTTSSALSTDERTMPTGENTLIIQTTPALSHRYCACQQYIYQEPRMSFAQVVNTVNRQPWEQ